METLKKNIAPSVLLIAGALSAIIIAMSTAVLTANSQPPFNTYLHLFSGISESALYVMFAWTAKAYYTGSRELGRAVTWLRRAGYIFCALYGIKGVMFVARDVADAADIQSKVLALGGGLLQPAVVIIACLLVLDILGAYLKAKAENALTV